jgi:cell division protein FtsL
MKKLLFGRWYNYAAVAVILIMAMGLYRAREEQDAARARIAVLEKKVEVARGDVQTLTAETALLGTPERIERLAREQLGLSPATLAQTGDATDLPAIEATSTPQTAAGGKP